jgi:hypothetical protein
MKKEKTPSPPPLEAIENPVAEYYVEGADWRVDRWELLSAEIPELKREELVDFHTFTRDNVSPRSWMVVRRLFGFSPFIIPTAGNPDDYRALTRGELAAKLEISINELEAELEAVRLAWRRRKHLNDVALAGTKPNIPAQPNALPMATEAEDDEYLVRFSISPTIFDLPIRKPEENRLEKAWFVKRVREWEPLLTKSTMTEQLAKDTLNNELRLRREQDMLWSIDREPACGVAKTQARERRKGIIADRIKELQELHAAQLDAIQEHAPWFNVAEAQISATGAIAQLIQGMLDWEARGDSQLIDGVFTSNELQVLLRTNKQMDEPRYRWGWTMYVNESKQWLWDPKAKGWMRERDLARFDNGFKEGVKKFNETSEERVVDLEADGPEGEYEDLKIPEKVA